MAVTFEIVRKGKDNYSIVSSDDKLSSMNSYMLSSINGLWDRMEYTKNRVYEELGQEVSFIVR